jgi:catechol 2,3-dioxygenase-like lactoylglutathione lyase family enzyme
MFASVVPILCIFSEELAKRFYQDLLGFEVIFTYRPSERDPVYLGISRGGCEIHLTEHFGDVCPGAHIRIACEDLDGFHAAVSAKDDPFVKPGAPQEMPWGMRELTLTDPFGNRLTFVQC